MGVLPKFICVDCQPARQAHFPFVVSLHRIEPSVFILKPGQWVHINKNRLHCFRKMSDTTLDNNDCHYELRSDLLKTTQSIGPICVSIAWDWMYKGVTTEGTRNEIITSMEAATMLRKSDSGNKNLAQPCHVLLSAARSHVPFANDDDIDFYRGILAPLQHVVTENCKALSRLLNCEKVHIVRNLMDEEGDFTPYSSDFVCKVCSAELGNWYLACYECYSKYGKDANLCHHCFWGTLQHTATQYPDSLKLCGKNNNNKGPHEKVMLFFRMGSVVEEVRWLIRVATFVSRNGSIDGYLTNEIGNRLRNLAVKDSYDS